MFGNERDAAQRHPLPADRGLNHLVVELEAQRADRLQARLSVGGKPHVPVEPRHAAVGVVEMQEDVTREVGRSGERRPRTARELRAHHRHHALAEEAHRAFGRARVRKIAHGDVDLAAPEVDHRSSAET